MTQNLIGSIRAALAVLALALMSPVWGHPGHGDPIGREEAIQRAEAQIARLVEAGKIDKSWKLEAALKSAETHKGQGEPEWQVVFANPKAPEDKRTLFVFLSETGEYLAANFTGR